MAMVRPMLGDVELQQVQQMTVDGDQLLVEHGVPALEGDFLQRLNRRATRITLSGVLTGAAAGEQLKSLRDKFRAAEPVSFIADIATATQVGQVLIGEMGVRELAGKPQRFAYAFTLREFVPPPPPREEPPPPEPEPPETETGTLVVEVTVEGQPNFDFGTVTVSVEGTQEDGATLSRTLTNRENNVWTETEMPPGTYTARAAVTEPQAMSGMAPATVSAGQTTQTSINLRSTSRIAKTFVVHFRFDKAFVEPCMRPVLRQVAQYATAHRSEKLVIIGHTDKAGTKSYNQSLSERRARAVFAYLTFGLNLTSRTAALTDWNALRERRPAGELPTLKDSWDTREYQHILQDLGFYPGAVDGDHGPLTDEAVRAYRCHKGLPPGANVDGDVWQALIEDYLAQDALAVPESQFFPNCSNEILKWLGCGEEDPLDRRETAFRPSRRVELLFVQADQLPCQVPQPVTFDLPAPGAVNAGWCLDSGGGSHCCIVSPALQPGTNNPQPCPTDPNGPWCRQPAEPGTITVAGSIRRERPDGTLEPVPNQAFVLIAPNGRFKADEQPNGEPAPGRTRGGSGADRGAFEFPGLPLGFYSLEVIAPPSAPVLVRLLEAGDRDIKGNAVCKALRSAGDRLDVVIVNAPVLREIRLPVVAHLMTPLNLSNREIRTCPDPTNPANLVPQATTRSETDIRTLFENANRVWRQARIRFELTDIVRESYAHPIEDPNVRGSCEVDGNEFQFLLSRCAYPDAVNVFFFRDFVGSGEAGLGISVESGASGGLPGGCAVADQTQITFGGVLLHQPLDIDQSTQALAHELGHYLNLSHADETPANADRLMLPGTFSGANRTLTTDEVNGARTSRGATDDCVPLSLRVTGATQVGGSLSNQFIVIQNPGATVTVDAEIPDRLIAPGVGTLTMTGGTPGANSRQQTVSAAATGVTEVVATYTPASGGPVVTARVAVRVATFTLRVEVNGRVIQPVGGSGSTFAVLRDPAPGAAVTVIAVLDPAPFCVPVTLVAWSAGGVQPDPLRRTLPRANVGSTTLSATVAGVTRSVTINVVVATLEVLAPPLTPAQADTFVPTAATPAATAVRIGLWDRAFDNATGAVRNNVAEAANFVGADTRRFYFRLRDPSASGEVQINWRTAFGDGTTDHAPPSQALTLTETGAGTGVFLSRAVMVVTDDDDRRQPTNSGLPAGHAEAGNRNPDQSNHRLRRVTVDNAHPLDSQVVAEYHPPTSSAPAASVTLPVFPRAPEERRRIRIHLVNVRRSVGGAGILTAARRDLVIRTFQSIYARCGIFAEVDEIVLNPPATATGWPVRYPTDPIAVDPAVEGFTMPGAHLVPSASQTDLINAVRALAGFNANDIYVICVARVYSAPVPAPPGPGLVSGGGEAFPDSWLPANSIARSFSFVGVLSGITEFADVHEATHITTNLFNVAGGHFDLGLPAPAGGPGNIDGKNLMHRHFLANTLGVRNPKRLWNVQFTNTNYAPALVLPAQIDAIRSVRFVRNY